MYELLRFTPAVVDAVNTGVPEDRLVKVAAADGMSTLADECARLIAEENASGDALEERLAAWRERIAHYRENRIHPRLPMKRCRS